MCTYAMAGGDRQHGSCLLTLQLQGGAVDSYTDPTTGEPFDFGVKTFVDYGNATGFFARFDIPLGDAVNAALSYTYADFTTGEELSDFASPNFTDILAALEIYEGICAEYEDMLVPGYWDFPNASSIPADLLMNFGDFAVKYGIENALPIMFSTTGLGVGDLTKQLTIWVMQAFGGQMSRLLMGTQASFVPASQRNQDLYDAVALFLGDDRVMYSTEAISSVRSDSGVTVTVQNSITGEQTTINANKLLIAIEPVGENLAAFDLDEQESTTFSKIQYTREYAAITTNPSLPTNFSVTNQPLAANNNNYLAMPDFNFTSSFDCMADPSNLFRVVVVGDENFDSGAALALAQADFDRLVASGVLPTPPANQTELNFVAFSNHGPMHARVSAGDLTSGFIQDFYALQGLRSTWYTGGAWAANYQTQLWEFNERLLPKLLA